MSRLFPAFALFLCLLLPTYLIAQETLEPAVEETAQEDFEVPASLASAQATVRTFLEAFDDSKRAADAGALEQAASTLNLSALHRDLQQVKGQELAWQLKQILDRTSRLDLSEVSDTAAGDPWVLPVFDVGQVAVAADDRGVWLFTPDTVEEIPNLLREVRHFDIVEGVTEAKAMTLSQWLREQFPDSLQQVGFLLEHWQWIALLALLMVGFFLHRVIGHFGRGMAERHLAERLETIAGDEITLAMRPVGWFAAALLWMFGILWLGLPTRFLEILLVAVRFFAACAFLAMAYRIIDALSAVLSVRAEKSASRADDLLVPLFRKSAKVLITVFGIAFLAETLELPVRSVIAGLGIGGLAVALAAQDAIKNFFGSLMIIFDRPFSVGDWVAIGDVSGTVIELGFRSTRIRTSHDSIVTLPNSNLINAAVDNFGMRRYRRWKTSLTISYSTPPDRIDAFCEGVRELIRQHPDTRKEGFEVHLNGLGESALEVLFSVFLTTATWSGELVQKHNLSLDILRLAENLDVELAYPTQTLYLQRPSAPEKSSIEEFGSKRQEALSRGRELAKQLAAGSVEAPKSE